MNEDIELFIGNLHPQFVKMIEKERRAITEENDYRAYGYATKHAATKLALNDQKYQSSKKQLSRVELQSIYQRTITVAYFSGIGYQECKELIEQNKEDPLIYCRYADILYQGWEWGKLYDFYYENWQKLQKLEAKGVYFHTFDKMVLLFDLLGCCCFLGKLKQFKAIETKIQEIFVSHEEKDKLLLFIEAFFYTIHSFLLSHMGENTRAKAFIKKAITMAPKIDHPFLSSWVTNNHAIFLMNVEGNTSEAAKQFKIAYRLRESIGDIRGMAAVSNNIGLIKHEQGLFEEARAEYLKANELWIKSTGLERTGLYRNIAATLLAQGQLEKSLEIVQEGLELERKNEKPTIDFLYLLAIQIEIYLDMEKLKEAKKLLQKYNEIIEEFDSKIVESDYHYFLGILNFKESNFGSAKQEFYKTLELSSQGSLDINRLLKAQLQLANVLLTNYKIHKKEEDLNEAGSLIENVVKACREQVHYPLLTNVLIIRSFLYEIKNNRERALLDLEEAKEKAEEYGLISQQRQAEKQIELFTKQDPKLSAKEKTKSFLEYLRSTLSTILSLGIQRKPKQVESTLYGLLVLLDSGIPVYHCYFDERMKKDALLVSGLLTAVNSFTQELFSQGSQGSLKSIAHEDITIIVEKISSNCNLVFFADKDTSELRTKLMQIAREIKIKGEEMSFNIDSLTSETSTFTMIVEQSIEKYLPDLIQ